MYHKLYFKIQNLVNLEKIIDNEKSSEEIEPQWIEFWAEDLKLIREYYCEILIQYLYFRMDREIRINVGDLNSLMVPERKKKQILEFKNSYLFNEEFGTKMLDFVLGYILSQNMVFIFYFYFKFLYFFL